MTNSSSVVALRWDAGVLHVLDQRRLPDSVDYIAAADAAAVIACIRDMAVRGAPAIGIAGAYAMAMAARDHADNLDEWVERIADARPTAVNLRWAVERLRAQRDSADLPAHWLMLAQELHAEDEGINRRMADRGAALLPEGCRVLTHCNTGSLATGGWGTALGVIRSAHRDGRLSQVWVDETRPWLQGARLTAWELSQEKIPYRLIADSAAASLMAQGEVDWVIVGADRIAANGDTANKIGTYSLAVLAKHHGVKFMVVAPTSTIDRELPDGASIPIEQRDGSEVTHIGGRLIAPRDCQAYNPVFDVTPGALIDAVVTEEGVAYPARDGSV